MALGSTIVDGGPGEGSTGAGKWNSLMGISWWLIGPQGSGLCSLACNWFLQPRYYPQKRVARHAHGHRSLLAGLWACGPWDVQSELRVCVSTQESHPTKKTMTGGQCNEGIGAGSVPM